MMDGWQCTAQTHATHASAANKEFAFDLIDYWKGGTEYLRKNNIDGMLLRDWLIMTRLMWTMG